MTTTVHAHCGTPPVHLPVDPFESNRYHFGMLLGVADFEAEQAYHRGKMWLHNAWLHGGGAVWGLRVLPNSDGGELIVRRGLAIDHHGRELWLSHDECIGVDKWVAALEDDELENAANDDGTIVAHVRMCADVCFDRPVPSIAETCSNAESSTSYSRVVERARLELVVGEHKSVEPIPEELRDLLWVDEPADEEIAEPDQDSCGRYFDESSGAGADEADACDPPDDAARTCAERWHRAAVRASMSREPEPDAETWSPYAGDGCITLARVELTKSDNDDAWMVQQRNVDNSVRPVHVPTRATQELLWHALCCCHGQEEGDCSTENPSASSRPEGVRRSTRAEDVPTNPFQIDASACEVRGQTVWLVLTRPVDRASATTSCFAVKTVVDDEWCEIGVDTVGFTDDGRTIRLDLLEPIEALGARIVVRGGGESPLVSDDFDPLLGCVGDQIATLGGFDAVVVHRRPERTDLGVEGEQR